jgi:outer membrane protein TolC
LLLGLPTGVLAQQPITLSEAVRTALEKNPMRRAALAETKIASTGVREARSSFLPRIGFSESAVRGNDPVYVFGTKLRQQRFTMSDFALNQLNTPTPMGDFSSKFSGQWRLFDSMRSLRDVERARNLEDAANQQFKRADQELISQVVQAYYGMLLAQRQVSVSEESLKTAQSIEEHSRTRVESGMSVNADLLSAQVVTATRRQQLIAARNDLKYATAQLAITLGLSSDTQLAPADVLNQKDYPVADVTTLEQEALKQRPDVQRVRSEQSAQEKSLSMAKGAFGPRLNAFGSWQTDSRSIGWNGGNNWTAGLELSIDLFSGGAKTAQLQREKATAERVAAMRSAFENNVRLQVRRAYYDNESARQQVAVAKAATEQATESLRILKDRYDAGLATVTDLLRAEDAAHSAETEYWDAVYRTQTSYASLELASGNLTPTSPVVMP